MVGGNGQNQLTFHRQFKYMQSAAHMFNITDDRDSAIHGSLRDSAPR